jgi:membrane-bound lytic murein transglycosylase B
MKIIVSYWFKTSLLFSFFLFGYSVFADTNFERWKYEFRQLALMQGISAQTFDSAFHGLLLDPKIIENDSHQAEFVKPIWKYLDAAVSEQRIRKAKKLLQKHKDLLDKIEAYYGVQREYIVAIWGIESNYGSNYGSKNIIRSLATLAYQGRRKEFGQTQLLAALRLIENGDISAGQMVGSWAGAIGQTQFIPTTYEAYAVDFDGDGARNLIHSTADALASAANYLAKAGWKANQNWGAEVHLPKNFNWSLIERAEGLDISYWQKIGLVPVEKTQVSTESKLNTPPSKFKTQIAKLLLPAGHQGPIFLVEHNFNVIKRYNNANSYALAVSYLSNQMIDKTGVIAAWPSDDVTLNQQERKTLQHLLSLSGFDTKGVDGRIGPNTRRALRAWQRHEGLVADGYINKKRFLYLQIQEAQHLPTALTSLQQESKSDR